MSVLLITHNLGIAERSTESGRYTPAGSWNSPTGMLFGQASSSLHEGAFSIPRMEERVRTLKAIPEWFPHLESLPSGCKFRNRCVFAEDACGKEEPPFLEAEPGHFVRCRRWSELRAPQEGRENGMSIPPLEVRDLKKHFPVQGLTSVVTAHVKA